MSPRPDRRAEETRAWVDGLVRSGLRTDAELRALLLEALLDDHPGLPAEATAEEWLAAADAAWREEARGWDAVTDTDRLDTTFAALEARGVRVLVGCADHWAARDLLRAEGAGLRGVAWFTEPDVWHAIDEGMLEVNLWHADTANVAPGDGLLAEVVAAFDAVGLRAHFDEGRIEVTARWQRRPA